ncbi:MAG: SEL1-like repeat protein [Xanthobacteraceae bacterium]|nr:SEL1-like repeat protein [Xanthobacteraceae bacterium]
MIVDRLIGLASPAAALSRAVQLIEQQQFAAAFPLLTRAAKAGIPDAEYRVARCYLEGAGVPPSRAEGAWWLERAASHGCVEAQSLLAALYVHGLAGATNGGSCSDEAHANRLFAGDAPAEPDFEAALKWARAAAERGSSEAQALLGYILTDGPESLRDQEEADRWYERSAMAGCPQGHLGHALSLARRATDDDGHRQVVDQMRRAAAAGLPTAIYLLGVLTEHGTGVSRDPGLATEHYREAAESGYRPAQVKWGLALIEGRHVGQDLVAGESWLRRAALAGDPRAAALIGDLYVHGGPLPPNYAEAASWYRRAAEAGDRSAARALGSLYLTGAGVARDDEEAARWLRVSAEAGDQAAQVDLAKLVLGGVGAPEDSIKIANWFEQAASAGDCVAAFNLGVCCLKGVGVEQDEQKAAHWLRHAAEEVADAQFLYARMLAEGRGVPSDLPEARTWFTRAAQRGVSDAQVALAEMMMNGRGGPVDSVAALKLFEQAAAGGHSGAMFALGTLHAAGDGPLPVDRSTAQQWLRAAAELGHGHAQLMLGRLLAAGEHDPMEARRWFEKALAQGIAEAESDLAELTSPPALQ